MTYQIDHPNPAAKNALKSLALRKSGRIGFRRESVPNEVFEGNEKRWKNPLHPQVIEGKID